MQRICRLISLRRGLADGRFRGFDLVFQLSVLSLGDFDLLIYGIQSGFRPVNIELKVCRINLEQKIAALYELIVTYIELDDRTGHARCNSDYVRPGYCIVSSRMSF